MDTRCASVGLLACAFASGCMTYAAQINRPVARGDVSARVQSASIGKDLRLSLSIERVPPRVQLVKATLSREPLPFCRTGYPAQALGREPARPLEAPIARDEQLTLGFASEAFAPFGRDEEPRLDLLLSTPLGNQRCIPLYLGDPRALEWEPVQRWTLGAGFSIEGFTNSLGSVSRIFTVPLEIGVWLGQNHWELGVGVGGAGCTEDLCEPPSEEQRVNFSATFPVYFGVRRSLLYWDRQLFGQNERYGLGAALRYRAMKLAADTYRGREELWMHGPVLMPYYALLSAVPQGLDSAPTGGAAVTMELPVGYVFAENGERAVSLGFNLAMFFTVL